MKKLFFLLFPLLYAGLGHAQTTGYIRNDTVKITNASKTATLVLETASKGHGWYLKDVGAGKLQFVQALISDIYHLTDSLKAKFNISGGNNYYGYQTLNGQMQFIGIGYSEMNGAVWKNINNLHTFDLSGTFPLIGVGSQTYTFSHDSITRSSDGARALFKPDLNSYYTKTVADTKYLRLSGQTQQNVQGTIAPQSISMFGGVSPDAGGITASGMFIGAALADRFRGTRIFTGGSERWRMGANADAEGGSNSGSNYVIGRSNDAGTLIDYPLLINRVTGNIYHGNHTSYWDNGTTNSFITPNAVYIDGPASSVTTKNGTLVTQLTPDLGLQIQHDGGGGTNAAIYGWRFIDWQHLNGYPSYGQKIISTSTPASLTSNGIYELPPESGTQIIATRVYVNTAMAGQLNEKLYAWTNSTAFSLTAITRNSDEAIVTATVYWPDGSSGTFTTDTLSTAFPGAVDAYHITYVPISGTTKTITQSTITRNTNGAVLAQPALIITP